MRVSGLYRPTKSCSLKKQFRPIGICASQSSSLGNLQNRIIHALRAALYTRHSQQPRSLNVAHYAVQLSRVYSEHGYDPAAGEVIGGGGIGVTGSGNRVVYRRPPADTEPRGPWGRCDLYATTFEIYKREPIPRQSSRPSAWRYNLNTLICRSNTNYGCLELTVRWFTFCRATNQTHNCACTICWNIAFRYHSSGFANYTHILWNRLTNGVVVPGNTMDTQNVLGSLCIFYINYYPAI